MKPIYFLLIVNIIFLISLSSLSYQQQFKGCNGNENNQPVIYNPPVLLNSTTNGKKYLIQNGTNYVYIAQLYGSPSEMGQAYGKLFAEEISYNVKAMFGYVKKMAVDWLVSVHVPKFIADLLGDLGIHILNFALDLNWWVAKPYIPKRYEEELKGIAKGSGGKIDYLDLRRINMFPELTQAACTIIGAWAPSTTNAQLLQLRALDWASDAPVNKYPAIVIYNSIESNSFPFANIGFAGLIGSLTAFSSNGVAVGEKVWYPQKSMNSKKTYFGKPWMFVLRDLAQFGTTLDQMILTLENTHRTMQIHIGLGDATNKSFRGFDYSKNILINFNDKNYTNYSPAHPQMDGIMYFDKYVDPSNNYCVGQILQYYYGKITPATLYREVVGFHETGDTQVCVFDIYSNHIYLAYSEFGTNQKAYTRSMIYVDFNQFWNSTEIQII